MGTGCLAGSWAVMIFFHHGLFCSRVKLLKVTEKQYVVSVEEK